MLKYLAITIFAAATMAAASPALAQRGTGPASSGGHNALNPGSLVDSREMVVTRGIPTRMKVNDRSAQVARATPPVPAEVRAAIQNLAQQTGRECQLVDSRRVGFDAQHNPIYEAACANSLGYVFVAGAPPTVKDCVQLSSAARSARDQNPSADVGALCELPANADMIRVVADMAATAGVTCQIDDVLAAGERNSAVIYEVGCAGSDGYWLQPGKAGLQKVECLQIMAEGGACQLTTGEEQAASVAHWLRSAHQVDCQVQEARYMGSAAGSSFYEARCQAGNGYVAELDEEKVVRRVLRCEDAINLGGGCVLRNEG